MNPEDKIKELEGKLEELTKKFETFYNAASLPPEFVESLSKNGFVQIKQIVSTPVITVDGYTSKTYYLFSKTNETDLILGGIDKSEFIIITDIDTSTNVVTSPSHGLVDTNPVTFRTTETAPSGLTNGGTYYIRDDGTDTFKLTDTIGGAAIDITSVGSGQHYLQKIMTII